MKELSTTYGKKNCLLHLRKWNGEKITSYTTTEER
jgi:hypothetical protein